MAAFEVGTRFDVLLHQLKAEHEFSISRFSQIDQNLPSRLAQNAVPRCSYDNAGLANDCASKLFVSGNGVTTGFADSTSKTSISYQSDHSQALPSVAFPSARLPTEKPDEPTCANDLPPAVGVRDVGDRTISGDALASAGLTTVSGIVSSQPYRLLTEGGSSRCLAEHSVNSLSSPGAPLGSSSKSLQFDQSQSSPRALAGSASKATLKLDHFMPCELEMERSENRSLNQIQEDDETRSSPWELLGDTLQFSEGLTASQMVAKAQLWRFAQPVVGVSKTNVIDNMGLKRCHSLRERAQIRLGNVARRSGQKPLDRQMSRMRSIALFSRRNPLTALDSTMTVVIVLNAIAIGVSCDTPHWGGWIVVDLSFVTFFILEIFCRLYLIGTRDYFCGSLWHWFEMVLVLLSLLELGAYAPDLFLDGSSSIRVFRLLRLAKMMRMCRLHWFKDLVMMFNGAVGGLRTLSWSIILIAMPLYVVALVLRESLGEEVPRHGTPADDVRKHFSSLSDSFFTVFRCILASDCTDDDGRPIFVLASHYSWIYGGIYFLTFIFMTLGLCNVIVAIFVENTMAAAKHNDLKKKEERLRDHDLFREKGLQLALLAYCLKNDLDPAMMTLDTVDIDVVYNLEITQEDFVQICDHPGFCEILDDLDISREDHPVLFDTLDRDRGGTLDVNELIGGIGKLRGDIRKSDIVTVMLGVRHISRLLKSFRSDMMYILRRHDDLLCALGRQGRISLQSVKESAKRSSLHSV